MKYLTLLLFINTANTFAQRPREIQLSDEPTDFTDPWMILFCIIIPVFLILAGVYINKRSSNKKK